MAVLTIPDEHRTLHRVEEIQDYLLERGIGYEYRPLPAGVKNCLSVSGTVLLDSLLQDLSGYMALHGYQSADIVSINPETPNLDAIRQKFIEEHTHAEDEVRYFLSGEGFFWFNLEQYPVFCVTCQVGDLLNVPAGVRHWFQLQDDPNVKAVRLFTNKGGWVPDYTRSGIHNKYVCLTGRTEM